MTIWSRSGLVVSRPCFGLTCVLSSTNDRCIYFIVFGLFCCFYVRPYNKMCLSVVRGGKFLLNFALFWAQGTLLLHPKLFFMLLYCGQILG
uniref:Uncharacterized protein n=1 Tax=Anguilla anguilla TaxID=7936 RepID=A0A0E9UPA8_ANGAN